MSARLKTMSKISVKRRKFEIKRKRKRSKKLAKLREAYFSAKTKSKRDAILEKLNKIVPHFSEKEFLKK